jgi:hypothetical protein
MEHGHLPFQAWQNYYVIIGSAAAALTGLQFIVVVLGAQANIMSKMAARAFGSPTIIHFCASLLIAAVLTAPWSSQTAPAYGLAVCAVAGGASVLRALLHARAQTDYRPVLEDWLWHFTFPLLAYVALFGAALTLGRHAATALFVVAGAALALLLIGIHNAWDSVVYIAVDRPGAGGST